VVAIYGTPTVVNESVYVGGHDGKIYDISAESGRYKEQYLDAKEPQPIVGGTVVDQGIIYVGSANGVVYALNATNFQEEWQFPTGDKIWSTPTIEDNALYIGSFDKNLYAININNGSKLWEFKTDGAIITQPLVQDKIVYIGSFDRHLYAVNALSGNTLWQFPVDDEAEGNPKNWFWAQPVIDNDTIYAGNLDGHVYIIDLTTGQPQADAINLESPIAATPVIINDSVIVATEEGLIYSVNTLSNQHQLLADIKKLADEKELTIRAALTMNDGILYVHAQTKKQGSFVCALNATNGTMQWGRLIISE
jgi:outer membrane protein assembly factor BamB